LLNRFESVSETMRPDRRYRTVRAGLF